MHWLCVLQELNAITCIVVVWSAAEFGGVLRSICLPAKQWLYWGSFWPDIIGCGMLQVCTEYDCTSFLSCCFCSWHPRLVAILESCVSEQKKLAGTSHWYQDCAADFNPPWLCSAAASEGMRAITSLPILPMRQRLPILSFLSCSPSPPSSPRVGPG